MLKRIIKYISGYSIILVESVYAIKAINILLSYSLTEDELNRDKDGSVAFRISNVNMKIFSRLAEENMIEYVVLSTRGFGTFIRSHIDRIGLLIGGSVVALILAVSSQYVWGFTFVGNTTVTDSEIIEILNNVGFGIGTKYSDVDFPLLQNDALMYTDKLAWISVNMSGSLAQVEVLERVKGNETDFTGKYANVIATEDGTIELIVEAGGEVVVEPGDFVRKGDLLISGITADKSGNLRYEYARGSIKARVTRSFTIESPKFISEKSYTGKQKKDFAIKILGKSINLFVKGGSSYEEYDIIEEKEQIHLFGIFPIPVILESIVYNEYETVEKELTENEIVSSALLQYAEAIKETVGEGELLEKSVESYYSDDKYVIECKLICLDEITETVIFQADNNMEDYDTENRRDR